MAQPPVNDRTALTSGASIVADDPGRATEAAYRAILDNLEQCVFLKSPTLQFITANRRFCQDLGVTRENLAGKTDFDFYPRHLAEKYRADDLAVLTGGRRIETEEQNLAGNTMRTVRIVKTPLRDNRGQVSGVLGIFWDVTEQRSLEARLRHAQEGAALGQLASGMAHDFNNLMTAILGNISLTLSALPDADPNRELLTAAEKAALRASELTNRFLGLARQTILLVDDEPIIRSLGRTILEREGYRVLLAEDGHEAVETYRKQEGRIDLVILDLTMPRLSGHDAFRQLQKIDPHVHALFASGYSAEHVSEDESAHILGFVGKPYRPDELARIVRTTLEKIRTEKADSGRVAMTPC